MTADVLPTPPTALDRSNLVVISATRNEHRSVALVLAEMARARDELDTLGFRLELLVVDDSDTPETAEELASEAKLRDLRLTVIKGPGRGIGAAFVAGFEYALRALSPQLLATMDCDGQHDATQLPSLVRAKLAGDDLLVIGSRFVPGSTLTGLTFARKLISKLGNQLIRRLSGHALPADATTSFRVFEPELARLFLRHGLVAGCTGYSFFSLFVLFATITGPCREVPIDFRRAWWGARTSRWRSACSSPAACPTSADGPPSGSGSPPPSPSGRPATSGACRSWRGCRTTPVGSSRSCNRGCAAPSSRWVLGSAR